MSIVKGSFKKTKTEARNAYVAELEQHARPKRLKSRTSSYIKLRLELIE